MNRIVAIVLCILCFSLKLQAQSLSAEEVIATMNRAFELNKNENYVEALKSFLIVGKNTEQQSTEEERQVYVCSQTMACACYELTGQYEKGYLLAKKLLQGSLSEAEKKDISYQYVLNGYMVACGLIKRDETGRAQYKLGREIFQEIAPYANGQLKRYVLPKIPLSWYFEGSEHSIQQKYDEALDCFGQALSGYKNLKDTANMIPVLKAMASAKYHSYDIDGATMYYNDALSLSRTVNDVTAQIAVITELWQLSSLVGDVKRARDYTASMDSLVENSADAKVKFTYYDQKGDEAAKQKQYHLAEQWYLKAKTLAESAVPSAVSPNKYIAYSNLCRLYEAMGQYDDALSFGHKAVEEYQRQFSDEDITFYMPYNTLAVIYAKTGNRDKCFAALDSLFRGERRIEEPRELHRLYQTRAQCHAAFKDYPSALADYRKADAILAAKYPDDDGDRIIMSALIGGMENRVGNYAEAESRYQQYAEHIRRLYGENSVEYVDAQIYLANAKGFAGHIESGCQDYAMATKRLKNLIGNRFSYMTSTEREAFWTPLASLFTMMTPYALKANMYQTPFTKSCYDGLVMSKAFLLVSERSLFDVVSNRGSDEDLSDYMMLSLMKAKLKEWGRDYMLNADSILSMSQRVQLTEHRLVDRLLGKDYFTSLVKVDYDAVKGVLASDETLVDFTDFLTESSGRKYAAYIINSSQDYPLLKSLFAEHQVDSLGISRPDMFYDADYASDILRLIWQPLVGHIAKGSTVYYVPSQLLFQVSLESLPLEDGSLLGHHYNFVRLSSARELLKMKGEDKTVSPKTAVLYGGLQYDLSPETMAEESQKYKLSDVLVLRGDNVGGNSPFRELFGTKDEIVKIASLLKENKCQSVLRMGMHGTEESFLSMHGNSPHILQIATHGFYYSPDRAKDIDFLSGHTDAMLLSGLVMSGGNAEWLGKSLPDGVLGGILTANDISRLDLSSTELVVLSACQSGQGRATVEGLYGLQRAFKKAGVGTMVMSLWSVSDKVTTDFMVTFYEQLTDKNNKWDKRRAFERTKTIIRDKYPEPFHWAAFVMLD